MSVYVVIEQVVVGLSHYPVKVVGVYSTKKAATITAKQNTYRSVHIRDVDGVESD